MASHLWQQQELSDIDIILLAPAAAEETGEEQGGAKRGRPAKSELARFPAHKSLLSNSPMFMSRVLRWQGERPSTTPASKRARRSNSSSSEEQATRDRLELELQDASEQEAALAVLQSLYAVKPLPELLSELTQEQQLQAAVLADMWQVKHVSSAAAQLLADALKSADGLAEVVQQRIVQGPPLPECLQPLLKSVLLSLFGDLEAVWANAGLRKQLVGLSLHALQVLLSCDELKVASEDTVLFTLRVYQQFHYPRADQAVHTRRVLAPLIRCQHLSQYWLSLALTSKDRCAGLLAELHPQIMELSLLRSAQPGVEVQPSDLQRLLPGAPPSWALGRRVSRPVSSVSVTWDLSVSELREAAQRCVAEGCDCTMSSAATAPLGGLVFLVGAKCIPVTGGGGCKVMVGALCSSVGSFSMCPSFRWRLQAAGRVFGGVSPVGQRGCSFDVFMLGEMAGGWDAVAWAAKGLPASGTLPITLTVSEVGHMQRVPPPAPAPAAQQRQ